MPDGSGGRQEVSGDELRLLAAKAEGASIEVASLRNRVQDIVNGVDRRGWNAGAFDDQWARTRFGLTVLGEDLGGNGAELLTRAEQADLLNARYAAPVEQLELTAAGISTALDVDGWEPILPTLAQPTADDAYDFDILLQSGDLDRFLTPLEHIDLSTPRQPGPWDVALGGLNLLLKAAGDSPSDCNDAFVRLAQAVRDGPDAVDQLQKSRPGCFQSRAQVRLTGFLIDGTLVDIQAESTLDQFAMQMTAMADQLAGRAAGARRLPVPEDVELPAAVGPGRWVRPNRNGVSQRALDYQYRVTGSPAGHEYQLNGVVFDGYDAFSDTLIEAKGAGYAELLRPKNERWSTAGEGLLREARGQVRAAQGRRIVWYVAEKAAADRMIELFAEADIVDIVVEYKP